jgi:hypothetical protein
MSDFTSAPWEVADGIVVCQGGSDTGPGPILFVLRAPMGTSKPYPHELLAEYADTIVKAVNNHEPMVKALGHVAELFDTLAQTMDRWATQSQTGGWSTHQVDENIKRANDCRRYAAHIRSALPSTDLISPARHT